MQLNTLDDLKKILTQENILQRYNLDKIGVYGSFARGEKFNDIDLYIDIEGYEISSARQLCDELSEILQIRVDLMLKDHAEPIILYNAKKDMIYVSQ